VTRFKIQAFITAVVFVVMAARLLGAHAENSGNAQKGRQLALSHCSECHAVDAKENSSNPSAPTFEEIANIQGMTATALLVALRTSHESMPNIVISGRDAENIIAYILSLKQTR
jgi:cytochrome c